MAPASGTKPDDDRRGRGLLCPPWRPAWGRRGRGVLSARGGAARMLVSQADSWVGAGVRVTARRVARAIGGRSRRRGGSHHGGSHRRAIRVVRLVFRLTRATEPRQRPERSIG